MKNDPFKITELSLPGVLLIEPRVWNDERGFFVETYNENTFAKYGIETQFVQDNLSYSKKGVLRGLHIQRPPHAQAKLVRCVSGEVFDVIADCNPQSLSYGKYVTVSLKGDGGKMIYIPEQYTHGFCVVSEYAVFEYKVSNFYNPECSIGVRYDDPLLSIPWPEPNPILSEQDKSWPNINSRQS